MSFFNRNEIATEEDNYDTQAEASVAEQRMMISYDLIRDMSDDEFDCFINGLNDLRDSWRNFQNTENEDQRVEAERAAAEAGLEELVGEQK